MKKGILIGFLIGLIAGLILLLFISAPGCKTEKPGTKQTIESLTEECKAACREALARSINLSNGPCLLDPMQDSDWVCDIAHEPREAVDNLRENQCNAWHNGTAKHFIELTPECEFIKAV